MRYVMIEQDRIGATVWSREADGWTGRDHGVGSNLNMPEIGISILLDDLYEGVNFGETAESA